MHKCLLRMIKGFSPTTTRSHLKFFHSPLHKKNRNLQNPRTDNAPFVIIKPSFIFSPLPLSGPALLHLHQMSGTPRSSWLRQVRPGGERCLGSWLNALPVRAMVCGNPAGCHGNSVVRQFAVSVVVKALYYSC